MSHSPRLPRPTGLARALAVVGLLVGCVPMLAMVPAGFSGALGLVGLTAGSGVAASLSDTIGPVAKPLLLLSTALLAVGGLRCSRTAVALAVLGGGLLYLSMYTFTRADGSSAPAPFYLGLALFVASFATPWARRRLAHCRPVLNRHAGDRVIAATLATGVIAVATMAVVHAGSPTAGAATRSGHSTGMSMPGGMSSMGTAAPKH